MIQKRYIVTLRQHEDLEAFYVDMETEGDSLHIPNRAVELDDRRPYSRNTTYYLTDEEAELIQNDPRVEAVELHPEDLGIVPRPMADYSRVSNYFNKSNVISDNRHVNWGLLRCTLSSNPSTWGRDNSPGITANASASLEITATGKNVDVVIVDGDINSNNPEFLGTNPSGGSYQRVQTFNWFQFNPIITGNTTATYIYNFQLVDPAYADEDGNGISDRTEDNDHGSHVAGTACGNVQGWASQSNIYNINPYATSRNAFSYLYIFDYIKQFHQTKAINPDTGRKNPTVVNNSWGFFGNLTTTTNISIVVYRGQQFNGPFTAAQLKSYGISMSGNSVIYPIRIAALKADILDCINEGIIFVGAAGNNNGKIDVIGGQDYDNYFRLSGSTTRYYYARGSSPSCEDDCIVVGASSAVSVETKATFSNTGPRVDVFAPGENIISTINSTTLPNTYDSRNDNFFLAKLNGTSMASPQVAGLVACLMEIYPNWTQSVVRNYIIQTAKTGQLTEYTGFDDQYQLRGAPNRMLYYTNEREIYGQVTPKSKVGLRTQSGQLFPRPRIYTYGKQA